MSGLKLICDFCGQQERGKGYLQRHIDKKHRKFFCDVCRQVYSQKANLLEHLRTHFERFICQYCGLEIYRFEQFQKHVYQKHEPSNKELILSIQPKETYKCRHCIRTFPSAIHRNCHEIGVHKGRSEAAFKCKECNLIFITKEELRSHSFEHYVGMLHFCAFPECDRFFKRRKQLRNHTKIHGPAKYECDKCKQKFFQSSNFSKHKKRCKGHPKESERITKEEQEKVARVAKAQFLLLGGKLKAVRKPKLDVKVKVKAVAEPRPLLEQNVIEYLEEFSEEVKPALDTLQPFESDESYLISEPEKKESTAEVQSSLPVITKVFIKEKRRNFKTEPRIAGVSRFSASTNQKKLFICHICAFTTSIDAALKVHLKTHKENFICCYLKFSKKTEYNRHMRLAHNISWKRRKPLLDTEGFCDICWFSSRSMNDLRRHMKQHLTPKERCSICQKPIRDLTKHMDTFHASRFACTLCDSTFKTKSNLKNHVKIHDEPTECPICHKFLPNMTRHIKWHSRPKPKPFCCLQCGKVCYSKQSVEDHVHRVHEKMPLGKSYTCSVCHLNFIRNIDLRRHSFIHYTGKIFSCDFPDCNEMFKKAFKLHAHMMVHTTPEANFQCNFCDRKYLRKTALHKHQKQSHAEIAETLSISFKINEETIGVSL